MIAVPHSTHPLDAALQHLIVPFWWLCIAAGIIAHLGCLLLPPLTRAVDGGESTRPSNAQPGTESTGLYIPIYLGRPIYIYIYYCTYGSSQATQATI